MKNANKQCPMCKEFESLDQFHIDRQQSSGLKPYCKECMKLRHKKYYSNRLLTWPLGLKGIWYSIMMALLVIFRRKLGY